VIDIRPLRAEDIPQCEAVLRALPRWFGFEQALLDCCASLVKLDGHGAKRSDEIVGFVDLKRYLSEAIEIDVLGVTLNSPDKH